jgi:photosystem II stability/assembly factor-like uncharacterized protein
MRSTLSLLLGLGCLVSASMCCAQAGPWQMEQSGTTASLRGVHAVGGGVVWASGTGGTVLRSEDSGFEWQSCAMPPGAEKLDFRAIWAWDANTAMVMSSGPGDLSRLYKTTDGCAHWTLLYTNPDKDGFWDALQFIGRQNGYILGDPVGGSLTLLRTGDGGTHWTRVAFPALPPGTLRGAFAASNSALALGGPRLNSTKGGDFVLWAGTGGPGGALLYRTQSACQAETDAANTAEPLSCLDTRVGAAQRLPLTGDSASAGIFSVQAIWQDEKVLAGVAVGGDYTKPDVRTGTAAYSTDGGTSWQPAQVPPGGYRSAVAWECPDCSFLMDAPPGGLWIAVGPNGSDLSRDHGRTWQPVEHAPANAPKGGEWNALSLPWVVGPNGRIAKLNEAMLPPAPSGKTQEEPKVPPR